MEDPYQNRDDKSRPPMGSSDRWILAFFVVLFFGLLAVEVFSDFTPTKIAALAFPIVWIPLVAIHEFGHAAMARLCGWRAEKLVVGFGRVFSRFKVGETQVELRAFPIEGFVMSRPRPGKLRFARLKLSLIYAAGPGIEVLLFLAFYAFLGNQLFTQSESIPIILAQATCLAIGVGVVLNLLPVSPSGVWSDGQGIVMSWLIPNEWFIVWSRGEEVDLESTTAEKTRVRRPEDPG